MMKKAVLILLFFNILTTYAAVASSLYHKPSEEALTISSEPNYAAWKYAKSASLIPCGPLGIYLEPVGFIAKDKKVFVDEPIIHSLVKGSSAAGLLQIGDKIIPIVNPNCINIKHLIMLSCVNWQFNFIIFNSCIIKLSNSASSGIISIKTWKF